MRKYLIFLLLPFIAACYHENVAGNDVAKLNQRISLLEQRLDSILYVPDQSAATSTSNNQQNNTTSYSVSKGKSKTAVRYSNRCLATTKKGTQCKRNAKSSGYCWQHE